MASQTKRPIRKILFHTRFREHAFQALQTLLQLQRVGLEEVVLTHIVPTEDVSFVPYGGYLKEQADRFVAEARIRFEDWISQLAGTGIRFSMRIDIGQPNARILSIAQEENVDWIITGRKKRTLLEMVYVGSHLLDILRRSDRPVLMHKFMVECEDTCEPRFRVNDRIFARPLIATDWSEPCLHAREELLRFAGLIEAVHVVTILDEKHTEGRNGQILEQMRAEQQASLDGWREWFEVQGLKAEGHLSAGKAVYEILRLARDYDATLIVLGRTGKDWFEQYWLGGVSHRVAEKSEIPVLIVP